MKLTEVIDLLETLDRDDYRRQIAERMLTPVVERILEIPETALPRKHEAVCAHRGEAVAVEVSCCGGQVRKVSGWHCGQRNASVTLKDCLRCPEHRDKGAVLPRASCLECVEKHLGAAMVLLSESQDGYPEHRLLATGWAQPACIRALCFRQNSCQASSVTKKFSPVPNPASAMTNGLAEVAVSVVAFSIGGRQ